MVWRQSPVEIAESAVAVAVGVLGPVLLPQQQQRHGAPFQLLVDLGPIGRRALRSSLARWREEPPLKLGIIDPSGTGQVMPMTAARRRISPTAIG